MRARQIKRITPDQIDRLTDRELRSRYSEFRDIAQKRIKRLEKAGFQNIDLVKGAQFPKIKGQTSEELKQNLADISEFLADPRSRSAKLKQIQEKTVTQLSKRGFNIPSGKLTEFGRFMENMRERYRNRALPPSDTLVEMYENSQRLGISVNVLQTKFKDYLNDSQKAERLAITLADLDLAPNRKRLSSTELRKAFDNDWSIDG